MEALIFWAVLGGLLGAVAKSVFWFESSQGWLPCILFGVAGGIAGGYLRALAGGDGFDPGSMGVVLLGAAALLSVYNRFAPRKQETKFVSRRAA